MATQRKPLPYSCIGSLESALASNARAIRSLEGVLVDRQPVEEILRRVGMALSDIHESDKQLLEIRFGKRISG